jgi:hypothetical protein
MTPKRVQQHRTRGWRYRVDAALLTTPPWLGQLHLMEQQTSDVESQSRSADSESPWPPKVRHLLEDWCDRADATSNNHFKRANWLSALNMGLGIPVVVLTTVVGTSVFATLEESLNTNIRIIGGILIVLAAALASLHTWLHLGEQVEKNRAAAERWAAIRREINETLALHPAHATTRGDPKEYLDALRKRIDEVAAESPEMRHYHWGRPLSKTKAKSQTNATYPGGGRDHTRADRKET